MEDASRWDLSTEPGHRRWGHETGWAPMLEIETGLGRSGREVRNCTQRLDDLMRQVGLGIVPHGVAGILRKGGVARSRTLGRVDEFDQA